MKRKVFELVHQNWGLMGPCSWNNDKWCVYDDNSVDKKEYYNDEKGIAGTPVETLSTFELKPEKMNLLIDLINIAKINEEQVDACDGDAWEFIYYENGKVSWKREMDYIYGIECLEKITEIFE